MRKSFFSFILCFLSLSIQILAKIPEPHQIFYGTIRIGEQIISPANTEVAVVLKISGIALASYTVGQNTRAAVQGQGNAPASARYILRVPLDVIGNRLPVTARPGDSATIYVSGVEAATVVIGSRGQVTPLDLTVSALQCVSSQSGSLLDIKTFGNSSLCARPSNNFVIASGHTVTWNGQGGPITGKIFIESGGTFQITGTGGLISGIVYLRGGRLDVNENMTVALLIQEETSEISIADAKSLTINGEFKLPFGKTLQLSESGTLVIKTALRVAGVLDAHGTIDLRGSTLILENDLDLSNAIVLTDSSTRLQLSRNVVLTTSQPLTLGSLSLNGYSLTLGSSATDLIITGSLTLNSSYEKIITAGADFTVLGKLMMFDGELRSTGGTFSFNLGGEITGGILDLKGTKLANGSQPLLLSSRVSVYTDTASQINPLANAGSQQMVLPGETVRLDGSGSQDLDGSLVSYAWIQTGGMTVSLNQQNTVQANFTAPQEIAANETLTFRLQVRDNAGLTGSASVTVIVVPRNSRQLLGYRGDINGDGKLTVADITLLRQCLIHQQMTSDFGLAVEAANQAVGLVYDNVCYRLSDLDGDTILSGADTMRLGACVAQQSLLGNGFSEEEANRSLGIIFNRDCGLMRATWPAQ